MSSPAPRRTVLGQLDCRPSGSAVHVPRVIRDALESIVLIWRGAWVDASSTAPWIRLFVIRELSEAFHILDFLDDLRRGQPPGINRLTNQNRHESLHVTRRTPDVPV